MGYGLCHERTICVLMWDKLVEGAVRLGGLGILFPTGGGVAVIQSNLLAKDVLTF